MTAAILKTLLLYSHLILNKTRLLQMTRRECGILAQQQVHNLNSFPENLANFVKFIFVESYQSFGRD